jgi:hypothetical protein
MDDLFRQNRLSAAKSSLFRLAARYMHKRLRPYLETMREGRSPMKRAADLGDVDHGRSMGEGAEA